MKSQENPYLLRAVDWKEIFPWLLLWRSMSFGFSARLLLPVTASLVVCITIFSWAFPDFIFSHANHDLPEIVAQAENHTLLHLKAWSDVQVSSPEKFPTSKTLQYISPECGTSLHFSSENSRPVWVKALAVLFLVLNFIILQMFIGRMTVVHVATGIRSSVFHAASMTKNRFSAALAALFFLALLIFLASLLFICPSWFTGWVLSLISDSSMFAIPEGGFLSSAINFLFMALFIFFACIVLALSFLFIMLILGALFGLPLMFTSLVSENSDCFDALSRAFAYSLQRPFHYAFYLLLGILFCLLGRVIMSILTCLTLFIFFHVTGTSFMADPTLGVWVAVYVIGLLPQAFTVIFICSMFSVIYMLLRRNVDAVELDEIWLPVSQGVPFPELPKLKSDPKNR
ncbi:MAG: hypothetical protein Q4C96_00510 [Planctomycetia bacterium]|nr:hypothetical protein [Planctomycetia bacterium]